MRPLGLAQPLGQSVPCGQATLQLMRSPLGQLPLGQSPVTTPTLGQKIQAVFQARTESRLSRGEEFELSTVEDWSGEDWSGNGSVPAQFVDRLLPKSFNPAPNITSSTLEGSSTAPSNLEALPPLGQSKPLASDRQTLSSRFVSSLPQPSLQPKQSSSLPNSKPLNTVLPKIDRQIQTQIQRQIPEQILDQSVPGQAIVQRSINPNPSNPAIHSTPETADQATQNIISEPAFFESNFESNIDTDFQPPIQTKLNSQTEPSIQKQSEFLKSSTVIPAKAEEKFIPQNSQNLESPPPESPPLTTTSSIQQKIEDENFVKPNLQLKSADLETVSNQPEIQAKIASEPTFELPSISPVEATPPALEKLSPQLKSTLESNIQPRIKTQVQSISETTVQTTQESLENSIDSPSISTELEIQAKNQPESEKQQKTFSTDSNDANDPIVIPSTRLQTEPNLQPKLEQQRTSPSTKLTESVNPAFTPPKHPQSEPNLQTKLQSNEPALTEDSPRQIQKNTPVYSQPSNFNENISLDVENPTAIQPKIEAYPVNFPKSTPESNSLESPPERWVENSTSAAESFNPAIQREIEPIVHSQTPELSRKKQLNLASNHPDLEVQRSVDVPHQTNQGIEALKKPPTEYQEQVNLKPDPNSQPTVQRQLETPELQPKLNKSSETKSENLVESNLVELSLKPSFSTIQREVMAETADKISPKTDSVNQPVNQPTTEVLPKKTQALPAIQAKQEPILEENIPVSPVIQRQPLGLTEALTQRSPLLQPQGEQSTESRPQQIPISNRSFSTPPENWSSIDDLLNLSSPPSLEPWEERFKLQSPPNEAPETLVSPIAESNPQTLEVEGIAPSETLTSPVQDEKQPGAKDAISDEQLEFLAQMLYGMIRDRLFQEKERYFHRAATHPPWLNIISPDFFKSITPSSETNAPNAQHQSNSTHYPPAQEIEILAQEVYKLVEFKLIQDKERQGFLDRNL